MSRGTHTATFYVQVEPDFGSWRDPRTGERAVLGAKAVGITQRRPARPKGGTIIVKLSIEVPESAFLPLQPEAVIVIPTDLTEPYPLVVEASDPTT